MGYQPIPISTCRLNLIRDGCVSFIMCERHYNPDSARVISDAPDTEKPIKSPNMLDTAMQSVSNSIK